MEMIAEAKTIIVEMICDECKEGKMIPTGVTLCTYPARYPHECEKCGHKTNYYFRYPFHKLVPIEPLRKPIGKEIGGKDINT